MIAVSAVVMAAPLVLSRLPPFSWKLLATAALLL